jgi:hypothetical protein
MIDPRKVACRLLYATRCRRKEKEEWMKKLCGSI